jgi:hypothetical protein
MFVDATILLIVGASSERPVPIAYGLDFLAALSNTSGTIDGGGAGCTFHDTPTDYILVALDRVIEYALGM